MSFPDSRVCVHTEFPRIERRVSRWLLLFYAFFILYGSFIPFRFSVDPEFVRSQWTRFFAPPFVNGVRQFSIPDVISNVLLFIPFGFLWVGSEIGKPIFGRLFGATLGLTCVGMLYGVSIEFGQTFSPGRTVSIVDAMCNGLGAGMGGTFGYFLFRGLRGSLGSAVTAILREQPSLAVLTVLILALVTDAYYPFEVTLDVSTIWQSLKHIHWQPFVGGPRRFWMDLLVEKGFFFAAVGCLAAISLQHEEVAAAKVLAWCLCIVFAAALEAGKLFFAGRVPNAENIIFSAAGALLGAFVVLPLSGTAFVRRHSTFILVFLVLALETYSELTPFDWVSSVDELGARMATIEWLPFAGYYRAAPQSAVFDLGKKLFIVGPLGFIIASSKGGSRLLAGWVGLVVGMILETCQVALRSRIPSITDVLLFVVGSWAGAVVLERFSEIGKPEIARDSSDKNSNTSHPSCLSH